MFTLYFEPIPIADCIIDMIEEEHPSENDFNYYGVVLRQVKQVEVLV
jgi:hypothetical protein